MEIGIVRLGRIGGDIARRLMKAGHDCAVFDVDAERRKELQQQGARSAESLEALAASLGTRPRAVWVMLPAGKITESTVARLGGLLARDDIIIDGGNSFYEDDIRRARTLAGKDYIHAGSPGAGHFVKMVHNGIEYGLMQACAESLDIPANKDSADLPEAERFDLDIADIAEASRRGSVISSRLLDLTVSALAKDAELDAFNGYVEESGEGRWTVEAAIEEAVPTDVLTSALSARFRSRQQQFFGEKVLSAMRFGFGGHLEAAPSQTDEPDHG